MGLNANFIGFSDFIMQCVVKRSQVLIGNDMSSPYIDIMYLGEDKSPGFRFYYALLVTLHQEKLILIVDSSIH